MDFSVIIPARYGSSRLPGKPLLDMAGRPMIGHVHQRATESGAARIAVATDDDRIRQVVEGFGATAIMTSSEHRSGTDRVHEAAATLGLHGRDIIVNLQGDEPLMPGALIRQVAENLATHEDAEMATLCARIEHPGELFDPHVVKVVSDARGYALYFSRASIPWDREAFTETQDELSQRCAHFRHIGLYAYRAEFLERFVAWEPCELEHTESLEQLRALWNGARIHVAEGVQRPGPGVDTEEHRRQVEEALVGLQQVQ